jgi:hypothetical protein
MEGVQVDLKAGRVVMSGMGRTQQVGGIQWEKMQRQGRVRSMAEEFRGGRDREPKEGTLEWYLWELDRGIRAHYVCNKWEPTSSLLPAVEGRAESTARK